MQRTSSFALCLAAVMLASGCGSGDPAQTDLARSTAPAPVPAAVDAEAPEEPAETEEAVEMTVEQTLAQMTESTFDDIVRVAPDGNKKFDEMYVYMEDEGQRRWEEQNPGRAFPPDSGYTMFTPDEEAQLASDTWRTDELVAAFDDISFTFWTAEDPARRFMSTTMYHVGNMSADLHDYEIQVPESAVEVNYDDDIYTLLTSEIVITRDGAPVPVDFGGVELIFFEQIDGEWKITPEEENFIFPFESLAL